MNLNTKEAGRAISFRAPGHFSKCTNKRGSCGIVSAVCISLPRGCNTREPQVIRDTSSRFEVLVRRCAAVRYHLVRKNYLKTHRDMLVTIRYQELAKLNSDLEKKIEVSLKLCADSPS